MGNNLVVYKKHKIKRPQKKRGRRTICEVLREINRWMDEHVNEKDQVFLQAKIEECYDMAKRMQYRLFEYQGDRKRQMMSLKNPDGTYTIVEYDQ